MRGVVAVLGAATVLTGGAAVVNAAPLSIAPTPVVSYKNCAEARDAGAAPIRTGEDGYAARLDRGGDGIACE